MNRQQKCMAKNGALGKIIISEELLRRFFIQEYTKLSIAKIQRKKLKTLVALDQRPDPDSIRYNCDKVSTCTKKPKTIPEIRKSEES